MRIAQGSSTEKIYFVAFSAALSTSRVSDHTTAGFTVRYIKDGSTVSANSAFSNPDGTSSPGVYALHLIDSTLTALPAGVDSRELCITISGSMETVTRTVELYRREVTTGQTLALNSSGKIADVESVLSKLTSVETDVNTALDNLSTVLTKVTSINAETTAIVAKVTSIDTDIDTVLTRTSPNNIGAAVWDAQSTNYTVIGSFGQANYIRHAGSAQAGGTATITLNSSASTVNNIYNGHVITITSGTGAGQARFITSQTSLVATVNADWHTNPAAGSGYMIQPVPPSDIEATLDGVATDVNNIDTNVTAVITQLTSVETDVDTALANLTTVLTKVTSINAETTALVAKLTSVETDVDSVLTKVTSIDTDIDTALTRLTSINAETTALVVLATSINTRVNAVQAQTTQLAFTQAGKVDANIHYVNNVQVQGVGSTTDTWRPV